MRAVTEAYGREEICRGSVHLIGVIAAQLLGPPGEGRGEESVDPLRSFIPAVLARLSRFGAMDGRQLPMVAGVLTAAVLGRPTVAWRDQYGPVTPPECLAPGCTVWLLADLYDFSQERPGALDELLTASFRDIGTED
ncbi:hypothetical protein [Streptomyces tsukubensis]|uniref:Uncharacterized protein n=1 Tax=Streptomyces tsukubensis TaxID=83656 RepID=A0A1V4AGY2_9ACTN|nr:hypothetical protein [Streptomyces tsukubensis]OON82935.1 hypothetical protein B1H18_02705 [Streptomyces tsukubensis]QFR91879.1 hypothetical protein GBW32_00975 [Streptomyces tsukubensis]